MLAGGYKIRTLTFVAEMHRFFNLVAVIRRGAWDSRLVLGYRPNKVMPSYANICRLKVKLILKFRPI